MPEKAVSNQEKALIIQELKARFKLAPLLATCELSRCVFYYQCQVLKKSDVYAREKTLISQVFHDHKGRYGYRRNLLDYGLSVYG